MPIGYEIGDVVGQDELNRLPAPVNPSGVIERFPLYLRRTEAEEFWKFPYEPSTFDITRSKIFTTAKPSRSGGGSIKEKWQTEDYEFSVSGHFKNLQQFPLDEAVERFEELMNYDRELEIVFKKTRERGVRYIAITGYSIPTTRSQEGPVLDFLRACSRN